MLLFLNGAYSKNDYRYELLPKLNCDYIDLGENVEYTDKYTNNIIELYSITPYSDILDISNYISYCYENDNVILYIIYDMNELSIENKNKKIIKKYEEELLNMNKRVFNDLNKLIEYLNGL